MVANAAQVADALLGNVDRIVRGKRDEIRLALCCLLTEGHLLLDDVPGTGKTSLAKAIANSIAGTWKRVQFTPDLLPTDITGVMVFDQRSSTFSFRDGPVFTNVLIGDEINRGSPKTQSALLEVMEERQVTADGVSRLVPRPFFVIATQNPRDFQGTFPLPEVQLDRFAMRLTLGYADPQTEVSILESFHRHRDEDDLTPVTDPTELDRAITEIDAVSVVNSINDYIVKIANATRHHPDLRLGVSTRGTLTMLRVAWAFAATDGRDYVTPDDVKTVAAPVFSHRMALTAEAELRGARVEGVLADIVDDVPVPRTEKADVLTRSGLGAILTAVTLAVVGWWWNYEEVVAAAIAVGAVLLIAVWVSQRPLQAVVTRRLVTIRVPRGDPIVADYRVRNSTRFRSGRATIIDTCDDAEVRVKVSPVSSNSEQTVTGSLPTRRRGLFDVGPFVIERIDPFWLTVGRRRGTERSQVIVHPKIYDLVGAHGAVRVIENESVLRRAATDPMSGFVSMREYVAGDDPRLIHWPTTARAGTLMVREHVEVRRPEFTVVLDTSPAAGTRDDFEEAVDVAATLAVHALRTGLDVVLRTTDRAHSGRPTPLVADAAVLDLLTPVQQSSSASLVPVAALFSGGFDQSTVVFVTGPSGPSSRFATSERMSVVRVGEGAAGGIGIVLAANDAREFVRRWRSWE